MIKKIISIALSLCLVGGASAFVYADDTLAANEVTTVNEDTVDEEVVNDMAGVLPDSPFYSLELKIELLQTEITKSQEHLAAITAKFAAERAAEAIVMANEEEDELAVEAANEYVKLLTSSAKHISKAIEAKDGAIEMIESLNDLYSDSEQQLLETILQKTQDEAFFEAKEKLKVAKMELKIARQGGGLETIQIAEEKVKEAEALKDELEELKNAAELAKEEVEKLADQAEHKIEKGLKQVEKANAKLDKLDDKASKDAQKLEEKRIKETKKQLDKDIKEEGKSREEIKNIKEKIKE